MKSLTSACAVLLLLLMIGAANAPSAFCASQKWVMLAENAESTFFYDKSGTTSRDGMVQVKTRVVYTAEGKAEAIRMLPSLKHPKKLYESRYVYELNCAERKSRLLKVSHLDKKGLALKSTDLSAVTGWEPIPPEARMDLVLEEACE